MHGSDKVSRNSCWYGSWGEGTANSWL